MLPVSRDCVVFLFCFSPSFLPYVAIFSGLTRRRETKQKQSTIQRKWQHRVEKTRETKQKYNTIQRNWHHRVDKTERSKKVFALFLSVLSTLCYQFLGIVLCFCFASLRLVYPMLPFSLDCAAFLLETGIMG
jgi:hypothetical protein